jgi:hypothetical protein
VSSEVEVHVYLQAGRVAWATDSRHSFAFTRYLQAHADLGKEQFREALDECRRSRLPLGETLVAWKLATPDQVREALRHQISCALTELSSLAHGQVVFLERAREYQHYAAELTFALAEFGTELGTQAESAGEVEGERPGRELLRDIRDAVTDVTWTELLDGEAVTHQDPAGSAGRVPVTALNLTLLDGARLVTLRSARGTLVGVSLPSARSLWCRVPVSSTFSAAVSALCAAAGFDAAPHPATTEQPTCGGWLMGDHESAVVRELRDFLHRAPEIAAAIVLTPRRPEVFYGVGQGYASKDWCKDVVTRRAPLFTLAPGMFSRDPEPGREELEAYGSRNRSLATAEGMYWCLGAELGGHPAASLWIFLSRAATQGLGWAYLNALVRRLEVLPNW